MGGHDAEKNRHKTDETDDTEDLKTYVQNVLQDLQSSYKETVDYLMSKFDEISSRVEDLEDSIKEHRAEIEPSPPPPPPPPPSVPENREKTPPSEVKPSD